MAKKILVSYNFVQNEIQNAVIGLVAGDPGAPVNGQIWYDSSGTVMKWRANGITVNPLARASHTGTQLASTVSDFDTQVRLSRLDQMAAPTGSVAMNAQKLTGLADGSSAQDAVTYLQLQGVLTGRTFKDAVRCASTANIATLSGLLTVDGITVVAGDRVLVKDQSTGANNGIYVAAAGAWSRSTDTDNTSPDTEVKAGMTVMVTEGTANADKIFSLTTNGSVTVGTTALTFAQTGAGTTYTQSTGITITGAAIAVDTAVVVQKYSTNIGDGAATSITVTHSLGTKDITYSVRQNSDDAFVDCDVVATSTTQTTFTFATAPAASAIRVTIHA
jgi:hypothetical protein